MTLPSRFFALALLCTFYAPGTIAAQNVSDPDAKEIAAYRLTMDRFNKVVNVNRAFVKVMMQDPKVQEAMKIEAELQALGKKDTPTEADAKRIEELEARKDALDESIDNPLGGDATTLAEMEARLRKYPPMLQALQREGMTTREYATFWMAFIQAAFAHGFQKSGMLKELPVGVNPENVKFVADHEADIQAMQKEFEALARQK
jgi:hypothetical protein